MSPLRPRRVVVCAAVVLTVTGTAWASATSGDWKAEANARIEQLRKRRVLVVEPGAGPQTVTVWLEGLPPED